MGLSQEKLKDAAKNSTLDECRFLNEDTTESITNYCSNIGKEEQEIAILQTKTLKNSIYSQYQYTKQNEIRSKNFNVMLRPFLQQFTADIIIMNKYLQTIDPNTIRKTGKSCK